MNEHDSERIAGLMEADGMERADGVDDADVIVLNTCCIRENADNKLYGNLGHLKSVKEARPDLQIVVAGCLAQKDRDLVRERAAHVDVVFGTHNVHRAAELLHGRATRAARSSRSSKPRCSTTRRCSRRPCRRAARDAARGVGHDPGRLRQQLRLLHRARGPRARDEPALRRARRRGPPSGGRRRHRGHPPGPERQQLRARRHQPPRRLAGDESVRARAADCSPTCCGRPARSRGSAGCASPAPTPRTFAPT